MSGFSSRGFTLTIIGTFILYQVVIFGDMLYLYATMFKQTSRMDSMKLLYVDYDSGVVGQSVMDSYEKLRGDTFPTLQQLPTSDYPDSSNVRAAVCNGHYWGALYTEQGASGNLSAALNGEDGNRNMIRYVWNGARYPSIAMSSIQSNMNKLIQGARSAYYARNATSVVMSTSFNSNSDALEAFLDPIQATEINLKRTEQGSRLLHNTVTMLIPILPQFFFVMAMNGISAKYQIFTRVGIRNNLVIRTCLSLSYTFASALVMTGFIWVFRESWDVNGNQFVLSWMIIWLCMHINFLFFEIVSEVLHVLLRPLLVLSTILISIASTFTPFQLSPGFFRWGYAIPAHELYQVLIEIWSDGCNNRLYHALPILFSWWISLFALSFLSLAFKCHRCVREQKQKSTELELKVVE